MSPLAAVLGAGVGLGLVLFLAGVRGREQQRNSSTLSRPRLERRALRLAVAVALAVLVGAVTRWPSAALLAAGAGWSLPLLFGESRAQGKAIARIEAVAGWAEMLRDTMAGAAGLEQAIEASAPVAPAPIRSQVVSLAARLEHDRLGAALRSFADDVEDPTCDLVVAALVLAAERHAARLGELLGTLAAAAREQATMRLRVEAGRARTRTAVKVIVGVTIGLVAFLALLNRGYLSPFGSPVGQLVLLAVGGLFAGAFTWLAKMIRPDEPARILTAVGHAAGHREHAS